ncbi:MAG: hypothetical protein NZL87_00050 [Thermomicrobium sp.]|nr:hypothetical protein [Thermomicrobium sp.]MDW7981856.1 hypothetical protein [Thermomicrobium sp.]
MAARRLYIWLDRDPFSGPPDLAIEDTPGRADLDLLAEAIKAGRLGRYLPTKIAVSPHEVPRLPTGYRSINVANLLRHYRVPHRTRYEVLSAQPAPDQPTGQPTDTRSRRAARGR